MINVSIWNLLIEEKFCSNCDGSNYDCWTFSGLFETQVTAIENPTKVSQKHLTAADYKVATFSHNGSKKLFEKWFYFYQTLCPKLNCMTLPSYPITVFQLPTLLLFSR